MPATGQALQEETAVIDERSLAVTRRSLHGVAELILAGSQHRNGGGIRLRIVPGGFGTVNAPDLRVETDRLVTPTGSIRLIGTYTEVAAAGISYGVSPGDDDIPEPYAYVGPWTPRTGDFWNATFGASRLMTELPETAALTNFFKTGRSLAALPAN